MKKALCKIVRYCFGSLVATFATLSCFILIVSGFLLGYIGYIGIGGVQAFLIVILLAVLLSVVLLFTVAFLERLAKHGKDNNTIVS